MVKSQGRVKRQGKALSEDRRSQGRIKNWMLSFDPLLLTRVNPPLSEDRRSPFALDLAKAGQTLVRGPQVRWREGGQKEIKKLDISEILTSLYNKYGEFLDSLTPDKIVCLFNIIIDALVLSSFLSVLSIMLSDNIINKIGFLEKYPRILNLLKLRNNINKKVSKIYLLMHFFIIIFGILGNIWMFFYLIKYFDVLFIL